MAKKKGYRGNNILGLVLVVIGLLVLLLPDPTSITDYIALVIVLAGLEAGGSSINIGKLLK